MGERYEILQDNIVSQYAGKADINTAANRNTTAYDIPICYDGTLLNCVMFIQINIWMDQCCKLAGMIFQLPVYCLPVDRFAISYNEFAVAAVVLLQIFLETPYGRPVHIRSVKVIVYKYDLIPCGFLPIHKFGHLQDIAAQPAGAVDVKYFIWQRFHSL